MDKRTVYNLLLILVYLAELWCFEADMSPWPGCFVLRLHDYSCDICLPGLRFLQYIYCPKQIGESAPLAWAGIASWNKTFARLRSVVTIKPVNHQCRLFVPGSVAHL